MFLKSRKYFSVSFEAFAVLSREFTPNKKTNLRKNVLFILMKCLLYRYLAFRIFFYIFLIYGTVHQIKKLFLRVNTWQGGCHTCALAYSGVLIESQQHYSTCRNVRHGLYQSVIKIIISRVLLCGHNTAN